MKKITIAVLLLSIIITLCAEVTFAQEGDSTYYIANEDVTVYYYQDSKYTPFFTIKQSYYFRIKNSVGDYTSIVYNNNEKYNFQLYVLTSDINSLCSNTDDEVTDSTAYYNIADLSLPSPIYTGGTPNISISEIEHTFGAITTQGKTMFATLVKIGEDIYPLMIDCADTSKPEFSLNTVPLHPITVEKNEQSQGDIISTPSDDLTPTAQNNLIRNIMIAIICVLCVIVIFLIFKPTKNAKNRYEMDSREQDDYDNNYRR